MVRPNLSLSGVMLSGVMIALATCLAAPLAWGEEKKADERGPVVATFGDEKSPEARAESVGPGASATTEEKREWLTGHVELLGRSDRERKTLTQRIPKLAPEEIDRLVREAERRQTDAARLDQRRSLGGGRAVGYQPVIGWYPTGTQFGTSGVVAPGGRYARISSFPFFSSVGPVNPYNYQGGYPYDYPYGYGYPYGYDQGSGCGHHHHPQSQPTVTIKTYHRDPGVVGWTGSASSRMGNHLGTSPTRPVFPDEKKKK